MAPPLSSLAFVGAPGTCQNVSATRRRAADRVDGVARRGCGASRARRVDVRRIASTARRVRGCGASRAASGRSKGATRRPGANLHRGPWKDKPPAAEPSTPLLRPGWSQHALTAANRPHRGLLRRIEARWAQHTLALAALATTLLLHEAPPTRS
mmetsp:Transcript_7305/g.21494  ORF Transcript_7305/g.21494 Transcript_7305/m.21494 type:complete len:154 (-) Transcript_7305:486-947(-)